MESIEKLRKLLSNNVDLKVLVTWAFLIFSISNLEGQNAIQLCGVSIEENSFLDQRDFIKKYTINQRSISDSFAIEVPVKFHFVITSIEHESDYSNLSLYIEEVNQHFLDSGISFYQCGDPNLIYDDTYDSFVQGDDELLCSNNDYEGVINVYLVNNLYQWNQGELERICGYANPRESFIRIVLRKKCNSSSLISHELGHAFSLIHTHAKVNECELVNGSNCETAGDLLCDTPADPGLSVFTVNRDCEYTGTAKDPNDSTYNPDTRNIMSYSYRVCQDRFSEGQIVLMQMNIMNERQSFFFCKSHLTSVKDFSANFQVYPNPASSFIIIETINQNFQGKIEMINYYGKVVQDLDLNQLNDITMHPIGLYFIKFSYLNDNTYSTPITIIR